MVKIAAIEQYMARFAPPKTAEDWDNVGLLVGDDRADVTRCMTCLTISPDVVEEAVQEQAGLIVSHHPLPFKGLKRLTTRSTDGASLLKLIKAGIAVYSPHTAFDSAAEGINQQLAEGLGLQDIAPLRPFDLTKPEQGSGRWGRTTSATKLSDLAAQLQKVVGSDYLKLVGTDDQPVRKVAVACGAAGEYLNDARRLGCDALILGETNLHTALAARSQGMGLVLPGHYASERFAVEALVPRLQAEFPKLEKVWASAVECDPFRVRLT